MPGARHVIGQRAQLREQVSQYTEQIGGLVAQQKAKESELVLLARRARWRQGALREASSSPSSGMTALERNRASLEGEHGQIVAQIAAARGKISEIELQILQLDKDFRTDVLNELRDAEAKIAELQERQIAAEDQLRPHRYPRPPGRHRPSISPSIPSAASSARARP